MIDSKELNGIDGMEYLASIPEGEIIVSMTTWNDKIYVASNRHIYVLADGKRLERVDDA